MNKFEQFYKASTCFSITTIHWLPSIFFDTEELFLFYWKMKGPTWDIRIAEVKCSKNNGKK